MDANKQVFTVGQHIICVDPGNNSYIKKGEVYTVLNFMPYRGDGAEFYNYNRVLLQVKTRNGHLTDMGYNTHHFLPYTHTIVSVLRSVKHGRV